MIHDSDCAIYNGPAFPPGECDCSVRRKEYARNDVAPLTLNEVEEDIEFLFSYRFKGKEWGTSVFARDISEAKEKIKAQALARYEGSSVMRIPAVPGVGLFVRFWCWLKNTREAQ